MLEEILQKKRQYVEAAKSSAPLEDLKYKCADMELPRGFTSALLRKAPSIPIIAECKKASPSKGVIAQDYNVKDIVQSYERGGAACLSVLTDEEFFQGHNDHLQLAKDNSSLPILRKDFILDIYQIYESRALGADCVLLIMAALDKDLAKELYFKAEELGMDILVEVHTEEELEAAETFDPFLIGVNARNLKTLDVDLQTSHVLADKIAAHKLKVAESGIKGPEDIKNLKLKGFGAFLVGEYLMSQTTKEIALQEIINLQ